MLKSDVDGTLAALVQAVGALSGEAAFQLRIVATGVGPINASDVDLAAAAGAAIVGFNVEADGPETEAAARQAGCELLCRPVIYHLLDGVGALLAAKLPLVREEAVVGAATVQALFERKAKKGAPAAVVAGCKVVDGRVRRNERMRLLRGGAVVWEGACGSLRRLKLDVEQVGLGVECGIALEGWRDVRPGDTLQCITVTERAQKTEAVEGGGLRIVG